MGNLFLFGALIAPRLVNFNLLGCITLCAVPTKVEGE